MKFSNRKTGKRRDMKFLQLLPLFFSSFMISFFPSLSPSPPPPPLSSLAYFFTSCFERIRMREWRWEGGEKNFSWLFTHSNASPFNYPQNPLPPLHLQPFRSLRTLLEYLIRCCESFHTEKRSRSCGKTSNFLTFPIQILWGITHAAAHLRWFSSHPRNVIS